MGQTVIYEHHEDAVREPMPYDSYSPLTAGVRGVEFGGWRVMSDEHYYGCCACIGSAGAGLAPKMNILSTKNGFAMNMYIAGRAEVYAPDGSRVTFETETEYPRTESVKIVAEVEKTVEFELKIRNPRWSKNTVIFVNGERVESEEGYVTLVRRWSCGDTIEIEFDMRTEAVRPIPYGHQVLVNKPIWGENYVVTTYDEEDPKAKNHVALRRGPIMLAQENRLGYSVDNAVEILIGEDGYVETELPKKDSAPYEHMVEANVPLKNGGMMTVTDYASAGKLWNEKSKLAVWMLTK